MSTTTDKVDKANCVIPGQRLGHIENFTAGPGTYVRKQHIYASVVGVKTFKEQVRKEWAVICGETDAWY